MNSSACRRMPARCSPPSWTARRGQLRLGRRRAGRMLEHRRIASCGELTKLELAAQSPTSTASSTGLLGVPLFAGGIHLTRAVGWYRPDEARLVALCEPEQGERLRGRLEFWTLARLGGGAERPDRRLGGDRGDRTSDPAAAGRARRLRAAFRPARGSAGHPDRGRSRGHHGCCMPTTTRWRSRHGARRRRCGSGSRGPGGRGRSAPSVTRRCCATGC